MASLREALLAALKKQSQPEPPGTVPRPDDVDDSAAVQRSQNPGLQELLAHRGNAEKSGYAVQKLRDGSLGTMPIAYGNTKGQRVFEQRKRKEKGVNSVRTVAPVQPFPVVRTPVASIPTKASAVTEKYEAAVAEPVLEFKLSLSGHARWRLDQNKEVSLPLLQDVNDAGLAKQVHLAAVRDEREVALGLDFGTSSVKVVIGDSALGKAFAVPFCAGDGLEAYLLPSRLFQTEDTFTLDSGASTHRDLKLSFLADPDDIVRQVHVAAFLALAIRRARGWLLTRQKNTYRHTRISWKVAIGLPAASNFDSALSHSMEVVVRAAWRLAGFSGQLKEDEVRRTIASASVDDHDAVDVSVVPEIAAQVYGFVMSTAFDKKAANKFVMVDVGAGTVDSCLFHVRPARGGRWDFEFYSAVVEPNGVANLHRHRCGWWLQALQTAEAPERLVNQVRDNMLATDIQVSLPSRFEDYFEGAEASFRKGVLSPDEEFFDRRVVAQVRGKTIWRTWSDNLLDKGALRGVPFFLCGGGARSPFYLALEGALTPKSGFSWLEAEPWTLGTPEDLEAEGLPEEDYDRISVAYGLSLLEVGKVIKALPAPKVHTEPVQSWRENYVDKDQC